jgi:hypothetical protein
MEAAAGTHLVQIGGLASAMPAASVSPAPMVAQQTMEGQGGAFSPEGLHVTAAQKEAADGVDEDDTLG